MVARSVAFEVSYIHSARLALTLCHHTLHKTRPLRLTCADLQAGMRQFLASYAYSSASAEQLVQTLVAALLEGAAKQPAGGQQPLCAPACLLPEDDTGGGTALGSALAGLGSGGPGQELVAAAAELVNPLLYSAGYAEVVRLLSAPNPLDCAASYVYTQGALQAWSSRTLHNAADEATMPEKQSLQLCFASTKPGTLPEAAVMAIADQVEADPDGLGRSIVDMQQRPFVAWQQEMPPPPGAPPPGVSLCLNPDLNPCLHPSSNISTPNLSSCSGRAPEHATNHGSSARE